MVGPAWWQVPTSVKEQTCIRSGLLISAVLSPTPPTFSAFSPSLKCMYATCPQNVSPTSSGVQRISQFLTFCTSPINIV